MAVGSLRVMQQHNTDVLAQTSSGTLQFDPAEAIIGLADPLTVKLIVGTTGQEKVNVARLSVSYNPELVRIAQCTASQGYQGIAGQNPCRDTSGLLMIHVQTTNAEGNSGIVELATVQFAAVSQTGQPDISYDSHEIVVKRNDGSSGILSIDTPGTGMYVIGGMELDPSPTLTTNAYVIPIGTTNSLTIQIGDVTVTATPTPTIAFTPTPTVTPIPVPPGTPYLRFGVSLFAAERNPEITVRVRLTDLVARLTPPVNSPPATLSPCATAGIGEHLFIDIPMVADGSGTYFPKGNGSVTAQSGRYGITAGGWIPLVGALANRPYSITVKAEKHRAHKLVNQITLAADTPASQDLDLSSSLLEPGDLPNPNHSLAQDCIVNSIDLSLIVSRIGFTDAHSLQIADVNYDNIVNGNDISKVVHTLSTKPDDDP